METIKEINEVLVGSKEGYEVITSERTIKLLIDSLQSCCEDWGYFSSDDNLTDFIGAELLTVKTTDTELKTSVVEKIEGAYLDQGGYIFITFETSNGTFQLVAYNAHNGYYGHKVEIHIGDNIESEYI